MQEENQSKTDSFILHRIFIKFGGTKQSKTDDFFQSRMKYSVFIMIHGAGVLFILLKLT
jgi:hypothetical protein